jgi:hypothetical protein
MTSFLEVVGSIVLESMLLGFVVLAVLRAWKMGSIFEGRRSYWQVRKGWLGELLSCPLCLSYHVAFWCEVLFFVPVKVYITAWLPLILSPLVVFAAAGIAQSEWFKYHRDVQ